MLLFMCRSDFFSSTTLIFLFLSNKRVASQGCSLYPSAHVPCWLFGFFCSMDGMYWNVSSPHPPGNSFIYWSSMLLHFWLLDAIMVSVEIQVVVDPSYKQTCPEKESIFSIGYLFLLSLCGLSPPPLVVSLLLPLPLEKHRESLSSATIRTTVLIFVQFSAG